MVVLQLLGWLLPTITNINLDINVVIVVIGIIIFSVCLIRIIYYYFFHKKHTTITIYNKIELNLFSKYVKYCKAYYDFSDITIGNYDVYDEIINKKTNQYKIDNIITPIDKHIGTLLLENYCKKYIR